MEFKIRAICAVALLSLLANAQVIEMHRQPPSESKFAAWPDVHKAWAEFKELYKKIYETTQADMRRMHIWLDNLAHIERHNADYRAGLKSYKLEMNQYGDKTHDEFSVRNGYLGKDRPVNAKLDAEKRAPVYQLPMGEIVNGEKDMPTGVDWRKHGFVTPVKNQGQCGSCWSFSTTGALEGQMMRKTGVLPSLSEQNLVDCSKREGNMGCNGGLMDNAFEYIKHQDGIDSEESYPYEMRDDKPCRYHLEDRAGDDVGYSDIPSGSERHLKSAVANVGPVAVAIDAAHRSFQFYSEGIYYEPDCSSEQLDHGVLLVGYGDACEDEGEAAKEACASEHSQYWIVKNSWGPEWGDEGFIKMARGRHNHCGIATAASYPLV